MTERKSRNLLLISPLIGFSLGTILLLAMKRFAKSPELHEPPKGDTPPPWWIRGISMAANKSGLQMSTVRSIAITWILTLPVSVVLAAGWFLVFRTIV